MQLQAYLPLFINAKAVLAWAATARQLKVIGGRYTQILHCHRTLEHAQLSESNLLNVAFAIYVKTGSPSIKNPFTCGPHRA